MVIIPSVLIALNPIFVRTAFGQSPLGNGWQQNVFYASSVWLVLSCTSSLLLYFVCPCIWLYRSEC